MSQIPIPGIPKEEFIEQYGEEAFRQIDHRYLISWNHEVFVVDGWADIRD